jgi:hypothetical protein
MKRVIMVVAAAIVGMGLVGCGGSKPTPETSGETMVSKGDADKGHTVFSKMLKTPCGFSGAKMSGLHKQKEWKEIFESGGLEHEIKKQCPAVEDVKDKYLDDLYEFFYKYGADSGNIPAC